MTADLDVLDISDISNGTEGKPKENDSWNKKDLIPELITEECNQTWGQWFATLALGGAIILVVGLTEYIRNNNIIPESWFMYFIRLIFGI